jgi:S1-C subfamily serine protease
MGVGALVGASGLLGGPADAATTTTKTKTTTTSAAQGRAQNNFANIPQVASRVQPSVVTIQTPEGLGSGVVWSADGTIVTDAHVVGTATTVDVSFADGQTSQGTVQATDAVTDLAVVKVGRTGIPAAKFDTTAPPLGDLAIALGSPLGFTNSVTAGVISGEGRSIPGSAAQTQSLVDLIQTDAAVSPGNSGGALVDGTGAVVGIVEAYIPPSQGAVALGFATPSSTVVDVVKQLLATGKAVHPYFGIQAATLTSDMQTQLGTSQKSGVAVQDVGSGSPAEKAGIHAGDVIVSVDGKPVTTAEDFVSIIRPHKPGDQVSVVYYRGSDKNTTTVTLADRPPS